MATIIHLDPLPKTATPVAAGGPPARCEIIIFPGVRIEREAPRPTAEAYGPRADSGTGEAGRPRKSS